MLAYQCDGTHGLEGGFRRWELSTRDFRGPWSCWPNKWTVQIHWERSPTGDNQSGVLLLQVGVVGEQWKTSNGYCLGKNISTTARAIHVYSLALRLELVSSFAQKRQQWAHLKWSVWLILNYGIFSCVRVKFIKKKKITWHLSVLNGIQATLTNIWSSLKIYESQSSALSLNKKIKIYLNLNLCLKYY